MVDFFPPPKNSRVKIELCLFLFFLSQKDILIKKIGRVKPGRVDDPHQKIVGLKLCWVVAICPKTFFIKKLW